MKCFWCNKRPNYCITIHLSTHSTVVCSDCIDNGSVTLCENYLNHEDDRFATSVINNENYCQECHSHIKKIELKQISSTSCFKNLSTIISNYV